MPDRDLTIPELAELLQVSDKWVKRKIAARQLPHHRRGRLVRFTPDDVAAIRDMDAVPVQTAPTLRLVRRAA